MRGDMWLRAVLVAHFAGTTLVITPAMVTAQEKENLRVLLATPLTQDPKPAPTPGMHPGLLGNRLDEAKRADFFTFFRLRQTGSSDDARKHRVLTFKPAAKEFHELVTVTMTLDKDDRIRASDLLLARSFVDHKFNRIYARNIAAQFLRSAITKDDSAAVVRIADEIEIGDRPAPGDPVQPSPGYQVYLGKPPRHEQPFSKGELRMENKAVDGVDSLLITLRLEDASNTKPSDKEPPDVKSEDQPLPEADPRVAELGRLGEQVQRLREQGRYPEAIERARQATKVFEEDLRRESDPDYAHALNDLAELLQLQGHYDEAGRKYKKALAIRKKAVEGAARKEEKEKRTLLLARTLYGFAKLYHQQGQDGQARQMLEGYLPQIRKEMNEQNANYATYVGCLGVVLQAQGDFDAAKSRFQEALEIYKQTKTVGEHHSLYADGLNNIASLNEALGDYENAVRLRRQSLAIIEKAVGKGQEYATHLNNLALVLQQQGGHDREVQQRYQEAMDIDQGLLQNRHPDLAKDFNNMAVMWHTRGDYKAAGPLYDHAINIGRESLGEHHPFTIAASCNLAATLRADGDPKKSKRLLDRAVQLLATSPEKPKEGSLNDAELTSLVALSLWERGDPDDLDQVERLLRQVLAIRERHLGNMHPHYAVSLSDLAGCLQRRGAYDEAQELFEKALAIYKQRLNPLHPDLAKCQADLGTLLWARGKPSEAEPLLNAALESSRKNLEYVWALQSERQQLAMTQAFRHHLDLYLSLAVQSGRANDGLYPLILSWKGAVLARQVRLHRHQRALRSSPDPTVVQRLGELLGELDDTTRRLANLTWAAPGNSEQLAALIAKKDRLEGNLSRLEDEHSRREGGDRDGQRNVGDDLTRVRAALPRDVALVDFLEYTHSTPPREGRGGWNQERRLVAFVVRTDGNIARRDLSAVQPIADAISIWRRERWLKSSMRGKISDEDAPDAELRKLIWEPLAGDLKGVGTVLISPDGVLAQFPFGTLPGEKPGSYLIEDFAFGVIPVPLLLPETFDRAGEQPGAPKGLLLVGDIDFNAAPGTYVGSERRTVAATVLPLPFQALEGASEELEKVHTSFKRQFPEAEIQELPKADATESAFRRVAGRHRWMHISTHGYYAAKEKQREGLTPPLDNQAKSARIDPLGGRGALDFHPGLLSGLCLAGVNRGAAAPGEDDGFFTALEVAALDLLDVELANLSACQTGLGDSAAGEGPLGLQRAFQVAGAHSVVASLWNVPNEQTATLMDRFNQNVWQKKMGKLEAIRQAQLCVLRGGGAGDPIAPTGEPAREGSGRVAPYFWAGFVLSGDWR